MAACRRSVRMPCRGTPLDDLQQIIMKGLFGLAWRQLQVNRVRSATTLVGVALGLALYVSLTSISQHFKDQITAIIDHYNVDITVQAADASTPMASRLPEGMEQRLLELDGVSDSIQTVVGRMRVSFNPYLIIVGVSPLDQFSGRIRLLEGRMPNPDADEALVGLEVAAHDYGVGRRIMLSDSQQFVITGVYASEVPLLNGAVVVDLPSAQRLVRREGEISLIFLRLAAGYSAEEVARQINQTIPSLWAIPAGEMVSEVMLVRVTEMAARALAILAIAVACILVMNTLLTAVSERTREIGILMAIGWSEWLICRLILAQSLMICVAGLILGNLTAVGFLGLIAWSNPEGIGWWVHALPNPQTVLISALIAIGLGLASAIYPAWVAIRLPTVQALRHE